MYCKSVLKISQYVYVFQRQFYYWQSPASVLPPVEKARGKIQEIQVTKNTLIQNYTRIVVYTYVQWVMSNSASAVFQKTENKLNGCLRSLMFTLKLKPRFSKERNYSIVHVAKTRDYFRAYIHSLFHPLGNLPLTEPPPSGQIQPHICLPIHINKGLT